MATPKYLRPMVEDRAYDTIKEHLEKGTGEWEGASFHSDFIYTKNGKEWLIREFLGKFETGPVSN